MKFHSHSPFSLPLPFPLLLLSLYVMLDLPVKGEAPRTACLCVLILSHLYSVFIKEYLIVISEQKYTVFYNSILFACVIFKFFSMQFEKLIQMKYIQEELIVEKNFQISSKKVSKNLKFIVNKMGL